MSIDQRDAFSGIVLTLLGALVVAVGVGDKKCGYAPAVIVLGAFVLIAGVVELFVYLRRGVKRGKDQERLDQD